MKWNKKGDYLLTGSCDETAIVWDVKAEEWKQQFEFHSGKAWNILFLARENLKTMPIDDFFLFLALFRPNT